MKIVINRCVGGFRLSDEARRRLQARSAGRITFIAFAEFWRSPEGVDARTHRAAMESLIREGTYTPTDAGYLTDDYGITWGGDGGRRRAEPLLVAVVEELGDAASGSGAKLEVLEIPDEIDWMIVEVDGKEQIRPRVA